MSYKKGQSAIEYVLLMTCFIVVILVFLSPNGLMKKTIDLNINRSVDQIGDMVSQTDFSSGIIPEPGGGGGGGGGGGPNCSQGTSANCGISSGFENCYRLMVTKYQGYCVESYISCHNDGSSIGYTTYCSGNTCRCTMDPSICLPDATKPSCQ